MRRGVLACLLTLLLANCSHAAGSPHFELVSRARFPNPSDRVLGATRIGAVAIRSSLRSESFDLDATVGVAQSATSAALPVVGELSLGISPNPFSNETTFSLDLPEATWVELRVFDVLGRKVATLADRALAPGRHVVRWATVHNPLPNGIYLVQLRTNSTTRTHRVCLIH